MSSFKFSSVVLSLACVLAVGPVAAQTPPTPIVVRGALWGAIVLGTSEAEPFAAGAETRLSQFADLVATTRQP